MYVIQTCLCFSEHVLDDGVLLSNPDGYAAEDDLLQNDAVGVRICHGARGNELPARIGISVCESLYVICMHTLIMCVCMSYCMHLNVYIVHM